MHHPTSHLWKHTNAAGLSLRDIVSMSCSGDLNVPLRHFYSIKHWLDLFRDLPKFLLQTADMLVRSVTKPTQDLMGQVMLLLESWPGCLFRDVEGLGHNTSFLGCHDLLRRWGVSQRLLYWGCFWQGGGYLRAFEEDRVLLETRLLLSLLGRHEVEILRLLAQFLCLTSLLLGF